MFCSSVTCRAILKLFLNVFAQHGFTCLSFHSCSCSDSLCFRGSLNRSSGSRGGIAGSNTSKGCEVCGCCCLLIVSLDIWTLLMRSAALLSRAFCCKRHTSSRAVNAAPVQRVLKWTMAIILLLKNGVGSIKGYTTYGALSWELAFLHSLAICFTRVCQSAE